MIPTRKTHVVHITQHLEIGGLESFIVEFCRKMDTDRFRATVLCLNGYDECYKARLEQSGVKVHLIRKTHKFDLMFLARAASFLKSIQTDIMHSHGGCFFYSSLIGKLAGVRQLIYTLHGMPVSFGLQARVEEFLSCTMTDRIVAVSDETAKNLRSRNYGVANKLEVIINGIDTERYRPIEDDERKIACKTRYGLEHKTNIIGSVGRLEKVKNYPLLLKACAKLCHDYNKEFHLVLVGSGSEEAALKQLAQELAISNNVSFPGMQYDLQEIYPLFDIFVLSSLTEGTSLSLLEAQSCGVPAVVTDVGGNSRIIENGINGLLTPSGSPTTMAALLYQLLNCTDQRLAMQKQARAKVLEQFDLCSMVNSYQDLYRSSDTCSTYLPAEAMVGTYDTSQP